MKISDIQRHKALVELNLLDTEPEKMFDDITKLASKICETPVALITVLDINKQLFKSRFGLTITETPIEQAFCKIAIEKPEEILSVEDARIDSRFSDNPLVYEDPKIVSYHGVPLVSKSGIALGSLCVIDFKQKTLSDEQKEMLVILSKQVEYLIELRSKTNLISEYLQKIDQYAKDMEEFINIAVHDLKAPVRSIDSFMKLLYKKHQTEWDEKDEKYIDFILQSTVKMTSLINDLLEYAKSTKSDENFETFDVKELVTELFNNLTNSLNEKPTLICDELPNIHSSKIAFTVLFTNFLSNAIKYKKDDEPLTIEITCIKEDDFLIFSIKDNGIGIESKFFDYIFKPFKRL
ncbi:MAG: ATP-binding protein, partial [Polaribacter sp.]|nr:ATP-binding protein [Polaribacter sp.]